MKPDLATSRNARRNSLLAQIQVAFGGVELGGGRSLHQGNADDDYKTKEEIAAARSLDTERRWQDVPDEKIIRLMCGLPYLDAEGSRFYLPAFMSYSLRNPDSEWGVEDMTVRQCDMIMKHAVCSDYFRLLSDEQRRVINEFIAFVAEQPGLRRR